MKKIPTLFLQVVILLIGIGVLAFMLWEPHLEGRNVGATFFEIYFKDLFLAYAYIGSIPFFVALYKAFVLLKDIRQHKVFSPNSVKALRTIKYCAIVLVGLVAIPEAYLFIVRPGDDIAGGVAMGLAIMLVSAVVAAIAAVFERVVQEGVNIKS